MTDAGSPPLVFSTDALPPGDRFDAWRETFALTLARVDVDTPDRAAFRASARVHPLGELRLIDFDLGPMTLMRTRELLRDGDDGFSLVICCGGSFRTVGPGGEGVVIRQGAATLVPHSIAGGTVSDRASRDISLLIPRKALGQALRDPDRAAAMPAAGGQAALRLMVRYVEHLKGVAEQTPPSLWPLVEGHILDLLARAYDPSGEWARSNANGGVRAALRQQLVEEMAERFVDPAISPAVFAGLLGISSRQVHLLLEETGRTYSEHIREYRLQAARRMLESPRYLGRRVIDVALAAGFSDLSYFNRRFRARFGDAPQAFRPRNGGG
jgi:AraC-like DNA-binding protein